MCILKFHKLQSVISWLYWLQICGKAECRGCSKVASHGLGEGERKRHQGGWENKWRKEREEEGGAEKCDGWRFWSPSDSFKVINYLILLQITCNAWWPFTSSHPPFGGHQVFDIWFLRELQIQTVGNIHKEHWPILFSDGLLLEDKLGSVTASIFRKSLKRSAVIL